MFICPLDHGNLSHTTPTSLTCDTCSRVFSQIDGVWHFLTAEQLSNYQQFIEEYETIRQAEGRHHPDPMFYRLLPFPPTDDPLADMWRQRADSFTKLLKSVVEPCETAATMRNIKDEKSYLANQLNILDLGAGNGWLSNRLAARGHQVTAVDLTTNTFDGLGCHAYYQHRFTAVQATFSQLPFLIETVDLAIFNASFHYATDYTAVLDEVWRLIRPGGMLAVIDTPVYRWAKSGEKMVAERQKKFSDTYGFPSNALNSQNFITYYQITQFANQLQTRYRLHHLVSPTRRLWRRVKNRIYGRRETAEFPLIVWEKI